MRVLGKIHLTLACGTSKKSAFAITSHDKQKNEEMWNKVQ